MQRLVLKLIVVVAALLGVSALASSTVSAQYVTPRPPGITTNVPTVATGGSFTVTVTNCLPGETVVITFQGASQTVTCNSTILQAGATFTAPTTPGTYEACAEFTGVGATVPDGVTRPTTACTTIQVLAPTVTVPPGVPGGGLPATGSSGISTTTTSAIVLISAGALLLIVTQMRRRRTAAA